MKFSNLPDRRLFRYNYNLCWKINGEKAWEFNNNKEIYIHKDQEIQKVININYRRIAFEDELLEGQEVKGTIIRSNNRLIVLPCSRALEKGEEIVQ